MKTEENLRQPKDNKSGGEAPRVVLRFSEVFLGVHPNHRGFHPGRLSTLYIYIYIYIGFSIITRSLTMEIERNLVQMIRTGPPEVSKPSRDLILRE